MTSAAPLWGHVVHVPTQRELQWLVVAILSWLLWRPIRVTINHWRLHRRQRKYPQLVVCRADKAPSNGQGKVSFLWNATQLYNCDAAYACDCSTCATSQVCQIVIKMWMSYQPNPRPTSAAPLSEPSSTPTQPPKRTSPHLSVLRKEGSSSSVRSRVEFAEHSNGHIRAKRRYYLPYAQPNQSIQPPNTPSPPSAHYRRSEHQTIYLNPEWPSGRPNSKRQLVPLTIRNSSILMNQQVDVMTPVR